jgi:hypothetical protein
MALSRYDTDGDGRCDAVECAGIYVPVQNDSPEFGLAADAFASQMAGIGVELDVQRVDAEEFFNYWLDPTNHAALTFTYGWQTDYLNAASWFSPLASSSALGGPDHSNLSLVGATPELMAELGYSITEVPSLDGEIEACNGRTGAAQFQCWAEVDQFLMERIVPWVPLWVRQTSRVTSTRVTRFSFDASLGISALDQIALARDQ